MKARLLHGYCISSGKKVTESVNSLFAIAEHYSGQNPGELDSPEVINGIPIFFKSLSSKDKSEFCYNQVTKELSVEALPVTINSLLATRRTNPNDPTSSVAGRFVRRVTQYVCFTLLFLFALYIAFVSQNFLGFGDQAINHETPIVQWTIWVGFGCVGALVHLLNNALTTTRLQTFDASEERKVGPRLLLGGLFGFVLPWLLSATSTLDLETGSAIGSVAAFFAGYSVRFSIGLLERLLEALLPETKSKN
ncbi:hypothetical protein [Roseobacter fucihabitans]|nr:hypothetical protein [Roseobacter litoralis]